MSKKSERKRAENLCDELVKVFMTEGSNIVFDALAMALRNYTQTNEVGPFTAIKVMRIADYISDLMHGS